jgi:predicted O-methyltransferase YrrM
MTQEQWTAVDNYITDLFLPPDPALEAALHASAEAGLPSIQVSAAQGKMLHLLARALGARKILEIGTLGGYSTIWLARALPPGGSLITLEAEPKHAETARANIARAGLSGMVELRLGRAQETLPQLLAEGRGSFDLIFIDADKPGYSTYLGWSLRLARPGTLIIADNVVRKGQVAAPSGGDANVEGIRAFNKALAAERRVSVTEIQTVGSKGYDGFALALVLPD